MTDKKYLDDSYLKEVNSVITEVNENGIILESTVFYPRGGGQPGDSGFILKNGKMYKISDTTKDGDVVIHHQESLDPELSAGDTIKCQIDWDKRYAHMRYHTAIHLIDAVVNLNPGYRGLITGSQIYEDRSRVDFSMEDLSADLAISILDRANEEIEKGRNVEIRYFSRDEALSIPNLARTKPGRELISSLETVRVVEITGLDMQADGGTHVKNLSEVGKLKFAKMENKGKNNKRVYFTLE